MQGCKVYMFVFEGSAFTHLNPFTTHSRTSYNQQKMGFYNTFYITMIGFILGDLRLSSGKLEILHNNEWRTFCSDNFDNIEAEVSCKQLGYRLLHTKLT